MRVRYNTPKRLASKLVAYATPLVVLPCFANKALLYGKFISVDFEYVLWDYKKELTEIMRTINLLILEDDVETLSVLLKHIAKLEEEIAPKADIDVTIFSNYKQVEDLVNNQPADFYDIILLDRDCKMGASFHVLNIEKIDTEKIISISSTPQWNTEARARGVEKIVLKEYMDLDKFTKGVIAEMTQIINTIL